MNLKVARWALMLTLAIVAIAYFAAPSRAQEGCTGWTAAMEEDEGGPVLAARACAEPGQGELRLTCSDGFGVRYDPAVDLSGRASTGTEADFQWQIGDQTYVLHAVLEEMDLMFFSTFETRDPLVAALKSGDELIISDAARTYPARTFSLKGSRAALDTLLAACD
jgi:hypothetical protein